jgi:hypothetical protein
MLPWALELGGTPWAASRPWVCLVLLGEGGWGTVPVVKKGMVSTDQILEELVVTPKAAAEGKRVSVVPGLRTLRMLCKPKHFLEHRKVPAAFTSLFKYYFREESTLIS